MDGIAHLESQAENAELSSYDKASYGFGDDRPASRSLPAWTAQQGTYENVIDYMPLKMGDMTVHSGWTLHCADGEYEAGSLDGHRLALAVTLVDARAPVRSRDSLQSERADNEDSWSYRDWINEVPAHSRQWNHSCVPILSPSKPARLSQ